MTVRVSAKALIIRQERLLLIRNRNPDLFYTLPGGGQEVGETLSEALRRECREELNLAVIVHDVVFIRDYIADHHEFSHLHPGFHQVEIVFGCSIDSESDPTAAPLPDDVQVGWEWVALETLTDLPLYPRGMRAAIMAYDAGRQGECYLGDIN